MFREFIMTESEKVSSEVPAFFTVSTKKKIKKLVMIKREYFLRFFQKLTQK